MAQDFARLNETEEGWQWRLVAFDGGATLASGAAATREEAEAAVQAIDPNARIEAKG